MKLLKKYRGFVLTMCFLLIGQLAYSHVTRIRVKQNQNGSLTWYVETYHGKGSCGISNSGININGEEYPLQSEHLGSAPIAGTVTFAVASWGLNINSYAIINTPYIAGSLNVQPYSSNVCWAFSVGGSSSFTPPPPPVCTSFPVTGATSTLSSESDNDTPCDLSDDTATASIVTSHLICGDITGDKKFSAYLNPNGANTYLGEYAYNAGITTSIGNITVTAGQTNVIRFKDNDVFSGSHFDHTVASFAGFGDTTPPMVNLNGDATITLNQNETYTETATADDNCSATLAITGTVDTATAGVYTLTYKATDGSGNVSAEVTRTVNVLQIAPITNNTITGNQSVCLGGAFASLIGSTTSGGDGVNYTYLWESSTADSTSEYSAASGTNNTINYSPSGLTQTTWFRRTVTSVGASDISGTIEIIVNPLITVNQPDTVLENTGNTVPAISFSGTAPGVSWTNSQPDIGLASSGTGPIPSFIATNSTGEPIVATITVTPKAAAYAYITNVNDKTVSVINTATDVVVATIPVGNRPWNVAVNPNGTTVYVVNTSSSSVSVISTATNTVTATIPLKDPRAATVSPDGNTLYVCYDAYQVAVISTATNEKIGNIFLEYAGYPNGIITSPDGSKLYVADTNAMQVVVLETVDYTVLAKIPSRVSPAHLSVTPDGGTVYVTNAQSNSVSVINTATNTVIKTIGIGGLYPGANCMSPDGKTLYATGGRSNTVSVINTATNAVIKKITVDGPGGVSVTPDGTKLYVVSQNNSNIIVVNTATNTIIGTINVGANPVSEGGNFISQAQGCPGNSKTFTITINPSFPEVITKNIVVSLDESGNVSITPDQINDGSSSVSGLPELSLDIASFTCSNIGTPVKVKLTATDINGNASFATAIVTVIDTQAPTITINGDATITHNAFTTYQDLGASATDNCGTPNVSVGGDVVDVSTVGAYVITYDAVDASSKNATQVTRTVNIVDVTPPTAIAKNVTVQLNGDGNGTITAAAVNNNSSDDSDGTLIYELDKTTFDCEDLGAGASNALQFDGSSDKIQINNLNISPSVHPALTAEAWINLSSSVGIQTVVGNDNGGYDRGIVIRNGTYHIFAGRDINTGIAPVLNQWQHVAVSWTSSEIKFFLNGQEAFTTSGESNNAGPTLTYISGPYNVNGAVDELRIWNEARTLAQIQANLNNEVDSGANLLASYHFNQGVAGGDNSGINVLEDASGNGYDGNMTGFTLNGNTSNWVEGTVSGGGNAVILKVTDAEGNFSTTTAIVTVLDEILPEITAPNMISVNATSTAGAIVNYTTPVGTDNCSVTTAMTAGLADGATFPIGTTVVTYVATDGSGHTASASFNAVVVGIAPVIVVPANITVSNDAGECDAIVNYVATETVAIPASVITYNIQPNSSFEIGTVTVTATATNAVGTSTGTFMVTVEDNTIPTVITKDKSVFLDANGNASITIADINNGSYDNCSIETLKFLTSGGDNGNQRITPVTSGTRSGRNITGINYMYGGETKTLTLSNAIKSKLVLSTLTAGSGAANRFWEANGGNMSETKALSVLGDLDLGTALQDCSDPVGVQHDVIFDTPITPGTGPEIFIVHGGLSQSIQILDTDGNVALTIASSAASSNVVIGGSNVASAFDGYFLRNNVNFQVQQSGSHGNSQNKILALDINPSEVTQIGGIRFGGGGGCNYTYEILGFQPEQLTALEIDYTCDNLGINTITLQATDASGNTSTTTTNVTVEDNTNPTITLNGAASVNHDAFTTYTDLGVTTADNCSATLVTTDDIDTDTPGTYTVTYTATDKSNNSTTAIRTVVVQDNTNPLAVAQDITVQLNASGEATITTDDINNSSSDDSDGTLTYELDKTTFDCEDLGANATANTSALNFSSSKINLGNQPQYDFTENDAFTLEAWINPSGTGGGWYTVLKKENWNAGNGFMLYMANGKIYFVKAGGAANSNGAVSANTWTHIAATFSNGVYTLYLNGVSQGSSSGVYTNSMSDLIIGSSFPGKIDDVRIWNIARSASEISDNMNNALSGSEIGLMGYYPFEGGTGSDVIADLAMGNNASVTASNMNLNTSWVTGQSLSASASGVPVTLRVTDASGNTSTATANVTVEDNIAPTITLNGDANITLRPGEAYTDAGATAADNCSGVTVVTTGTVDINTLGVYTLTYKAVDASNNESAVITRTVTVENSAPTFTSTPITSINDNEQYNYTITTEDGDGDIVNITASIIPAWLTLAGSPPTVSTFAGSTKGFADGTATTAKFDEPWGVAVDASGNVYVADVYNHKIRKITPAGVVSTFAGSTQGYADGTGTDAKFNSPGRIALDADNNLYVSDANTMVRKITPAGVVTTLAGSTAGFADGTGAAAKFSQLGGLDLDTAGNVYVADGNNHKIRKITPSGVVSTFAGSTSGFTDGTGTDAQFKIPYGIVVDASDNVFVAEAYNHAVRKITPAGVVSTIAGSGAYGFANGTGSEAQFKHAYDITIDAAGDLYVADVGNHMIRKVTQSGVVTTFAGSVAGFADGVGTDTKFNLPVDITIDAAGNFYVADRSNYKIRKLSSAGAVLTGNPVGNAGTHTVTLEGDDGFGGTAQQTFTITVTDVTAPTVVTQNITVELDATGNASITPQQIDNGSSDTEAITSLTLDVSSFTCAEVGAQTVRLTATDAAGNSASTNATVTVVDIIAPTVVAQDITIQLGVNGDASIVPSDIDTGSTDACGIFSYALDISTFDCSNIGENTVTLTVTDNNDNFSTATAIVMVSDMTLPVLVGVPENMDASCDAIPAVVNPTATDNCSGNVEVHYLGEERTNGDSDNDYTLTRTWDATDVSDNHSLIGTQVILVKDNTRPVLVGVPNNVTVQCDAILTAPSLTATDNCDTTLTVDYSETDNTNTYGLGSITREWTVTDGSGNTTTDTQMITVTACTPVITTQATTQSIIYGADASFTVAATGDNLTYNWQENTSSGFVDIVDGGFYSNTATATLTITKPTVAMSSNQYRVVISAGPDATVTSVGNATLIATKKALTVTAVDASKTYDGLAYNGGNNATYLGFVNGEDETVLGGLLAYSGTSQGAIDFGSYVITPSGLTSDNYEISFIDALLTVGQKAVTVIADAKAKTYGGNNPDLTAEVKGTVNDDTLNYGLATAVDVTTGIGDYPIIVTLGSNPNYAVSSTDATLNIGQKRASVVAVDKNKIYGAANPVLTETVTGTVNDDTLNYGLATAVDATTGIGVYPIAVTLGLNPNYAVSSTDATLNIGQKRASVVAVDKDKIYGAVNPVLSETVTGTVNDDTLNYGLATAVDVTTGIGAYPIIVTLGLNPNYAVSSTDATLNIGQKRASVVAVDKNKIYGAANPVLTETVTGTVNDDTLNYGLATAVDVTTGIGAYPIIVTLGLNPNYAVSSTDATLNIGQKRASVVAVDKDKIYGAANPLLSETVTGTVNDDTLNYGLATDVDATTGIGAYPIAVTLGLNPNYAVSSTDATLNIGQKRASVVAVDKNKIYGAANPLLSETVTGTVNDDTLNYGLATVVDVTTGIGAYPIAVTLGLNPNYAVSSTDATLNIGQKRASVVAVDKNKIYGAANPLLSETVTGTVNDDTLNYGLATDVDATTGIGAYPIAVTLGLNPNYAVRKTDALLTVGQKTASVVAVDKNKIYGAANPLLSETVTGTVNDDTLNYGLATAVDVTTGIGAYPIAVTLGLNPNYAVSSTDATLNIGQKRASVVAVDKNKIYGAANPLLSETVTGTVNDDTLNYGLATAVDVTTGIGAYPIIVTLGLNPNYAVSSTDATLNIGQKRASVVAVDKDKIYGAVNPVLSETVTGTVNDDTLNYGLATAVDVTTGIGAYPIIVTLGLNPNYAVSSTDATLNIGQKRASVVAVDKNKIYGAANPVLSETVTGTVNDDTLNYGLATDVDATTGIGAYPIAVTLGLNPNYAVSSTDATLNIGQKRASVVAVDKDKIYGAANPVLSETVTGTVNDDTLNYGLATAVDVTAGIGAYPIAVTLGLNPNYAVRKTDALLIVGQKTASVTPIVSSKNCGDADPVFRGTLNGFLAADNVTATYSRTIGETIAGSPYTIIATLTPPAVLRNYTITYNTAVFRIVDTSAPVFVETLPVDVTVECSAVPEAAILTVIDNCDILEVVYTEVRTDGASINDYMLTRTWTATDVSENSTSKTQVITVRDTTAPIAIAQDITVTLDAFGNATIVSKDLDNGSFDNCMFTASLDITTFDCTNIGIQNTVTLTVTDPSGNTDATTANVTILEHFKETLDLRSLRSFEAFTGGGAVTNSGTFRGDVGTDVGILTGFTGKDFNGDIYDNDPLTAQARIDLLKVYILLNNISVNYPGTHAPSFGSGETLTPGVYEIGGAGSVAGTLTLDGLGDPNAVFIMKFKGAFTAGAASNIILTNGAKAANIYWIAQGALSVGANSVMKGTLFAYPGAITLGVNSSIEGRLLSSSGAITVGVGGTASMPGAMNIPINPMVSYTPAAAVDVLGSLENFSLFSSIGAVANASFSGILGDVGANAGAISGFATSVQVGSFYNGDAVTAQAKIDLENAYTQLMSIQTTVRNHTPAFGSGETLQPGVYSTSGAGSLAGTITLDGQNNPDAIFIFKFTGAFAAAAQSKVILSNGTRRCNVFWISEGATSIGSFSYMRGTVLAHGGAATMGAGGNLEGRLLSTGGAIGFSTGVVYTVVHDVECGYTAEYKSDKRAADSSVVSFEEELLIYPNPSKGVFNIKLSAFNVETEIYLFDTTGKLIERKSVSKEDNYGNIIRIGSSNFASGIYVVKIITKEETVTKKVIIETSH